MAKKTTNIRQLERRIYKAVQQNDIKAIYRRAYDELIAELADYIYRNAAGETFSRTELYRFRKLYELTEELKRRLNDEVTEKLFDVCNTVNTEVSSENWSLFTDEQAQAIVEADFKGQIYSARIWKNVDAIRDRIEQDMVRLVIGGEYPQKLEEALMRDFNVGYNEASRLIRTEASRVFNSAALNTYLAEGVTLFGIDVTDDERLCESCKEFIDKEYTIENLPVLPDHPNCRCCYVALD